jgi:hypothetical protein
VARNDRRAAMIAIGAILLALVMWFGIFAFNRP